MVERIKTGTPKFTQLQNTLLNGRAYCCFVLDYLGKLARDYNDFGSVLRTSLVPVYISYRNLRVSMTESYSYTSYQLCYVTLPCTPRIQLALFSTTVPVGLLGLRR